MFCPASNNFSLHYFQESSATLIWQGNKLKGMVVTKSQRVDFAYSAKQVALYSIPQDQLLLRNSSTLQGLPGIIVLRADQIHLESSFTDKQCQLLRGQCFSCTQLLFIFLFSSINISSKSSLQVNVERKVSLLVVSVSLT